MISILTVLAFTSGDLDDAVKSLAILPDMLKLAEIEKSCQLPGIGD